MRGKLLITVVLSVVLIGLIGGMALAKGNVNGLTGMANFMEKRDFKGMDKFMENLSDADYQKMIKIMRDNGYGNMAAMMESIGKNGMIEMHKSMEGMHGLNSGMMGGF